MRRAEPAPAGAAAPDQTAPATWQQPGRRWHRSLLLRLTVVQALAVVLTLGVLGTALYKVKEGRLVHEDESVLLRYADLLEHFADEEMPVFDREVLAHRLHDLRRIHPELQAVIGAPTLGMARPSAEVFAIEHDEQAHVALDFKLDLADGSALPVRLMWPTAGRQEILDRYLDIILVGSVIGVLTSIALSIYMIRRWGRRLRGVSQEAAQAARGGRISTAQVDTELIELVTTINLTFDQLELAYQQSESFSADVAHELRSPLATMIGGTQVLLSRPRSIAELEAAHASNLEELEGLKRLVNDMLFLARADQGERAQSLALADLGVLADLTIDYCAVLFDDAGVSVRRVGLATAMCNEALIRRAIANQLSNAIRPAQGARRVELRLSTSGQGVRIAVFNSGSPLSAAQCARIFDRFYRANAARSDHGTHHGLGLSIVQAIARMHGGQVFAEALAEGNLIGLDLPGQGPAGELVQGVGPHRSPGEIPFAGRAEQPRT